MTVKSRIFLINAYILSLNLLLNDTTLFIFSFLYFHYIIQNNFKPNNFFEQSFQMNSDSHNLLIVNFWCYHSVNLSKSKILCHQVWIKIMVQVQFEGIEMNFENWLRYWCLYLSKTYTLWKKKWRKSACLFRSSGFHVCRLVADSIRFCLYFVMEIDPYTCSSG